MTRVGSQDGGAQRWSDAAGPRGSRAVEPSAVLVDGPWTHREIAANGIRFHAAEAGSGPLVLLLHGFPEFWWAWRHQLPVLAAAGYRAVAPDLRGYGGSDKPPRGYDLFTLSSDVAGMVRALGERDAVVVGHDWGGALAWCTAAMHPREVRALAALGAAHPLALRRAALAAPAGQLRASGHVLRYQVPLAPESRLTRDDGAEVARLLRTWSAGGFPDAEAERRYREAMQVPGVAHSALEYFRWAGRSQLRPDGRRFARALRPPVPQPALVVHGGADPCVLVATARASVRHVAGPFGFRELDGVGHFPHEEAPDVVAAELLGWLDRQGRT